jgi:hypothetical protein
MAIFYGKLCLFKIEKAHITKDLTVSYAEFLNILNKNNLCQLSTDKYYSLEEEHLVKKNAIRIFIEKPIFKNNKKVRMDYEEAYMIKIKYITGQSSFSKEAYKYLQKLGNKEFFTGINTINILVTKGFINKDFLSFETNCYINLELN